MFGQRLAPDLIFRDGFESNSLSAWSSAATDGGDLSGIHGRGHGLHDGGLARAGRRHGGPVRCRPRGTPKTKAATGPGSTSIPTAFDPGEAQAHLRTRIFIAFEEAPIRRLAAVVLRNNWRSLRVDVAQVRLDDNSQDNGGFFPISDAPHVVELDWKRSSGPEALDGSCPDCGSTTTQVLEDVPGLDNTASASIN